jgi:hypothetical protein
MLFKDKDPFFTKETQYIAKWEATTTYIPQQISKGIFIVFILILL